MTRRCRICQNWLDVPTRKAGGEVCHDCATASFIPGPWKVGQSGITVILSDQSSFTVPFTPDHTAERTAQLISAAPDLLAALKALQNQAVWDEDSDREDFDAAYHLAERAILKAEGTR